MIKIHQSQIPKSRCMYFRHRRRQFGMAKPLRLEPKQWWLCSCALGIVLNAMFSLWLRAPVVNATADMMLPPKCADVEFVFVRGSGEALDENSEDGESFVAWRDSIEMALRDIAITTKFYNLGTSSHHGYQYPAVAVAGGLQGAINLVGAYFSAGDAYEFGRSVEQGWGELLYYLIEEMQQCPNMKFVLGGYSQGAMILTQSLNQLYAPRILYVATFGDPKIYLPEGEGIFRAPDACRGVNLSPYREYVPDCHAYKGILGSIKPYQPDAYAGKLGTWCNQSDIMCSSGMSINDHVSYVEDDLYRNAAQVIRQKIIAAFPNRIKKDSDGNGLHNLALLFDITGSMRSRIAVYKREALRLAENVIKNGGKVRLYTYKDASLGDAPQAACEGDCTLTELDTIMTNLQTGGGGDTPESLLSAAMFALNDFDWVYGATKSMVALTDANFHQKDKGVTVSAVVQRSLEIDPVNFYAITEQQFADDYEELVNQTGGAIYDIQSEESLQLSTRQIWQRPVAKLSMPSYNGTVGEKFTFDASGSFSMYGDDLIFDWDLNGDGDYELKNAGAKVQQSYAAEFADYVQVRVSDQHGSSTMSAKVTVTVQDEAWMAPKITNLQVEENSTEQQAKITFTTDAEQVLLSIDNMPVGTIELNRGVGAVEITSLHDNTFISLAPYRAKQRGEVQTMTLLRTDDVDDSPDLSNSDDNGTTSVGDSNGTTGSGQSTPIQPGQESVEKPNPSLYIVPKVPNTGSISRKLSGK